MPLHSTPAFSSVSETRDTEVTPPNATTAVASASRESQNPGTYFFAGCVAAIVSSSATAPLDVLRTRLQSDFYQAHLISSRLARGITDAHHLPFHRSAALHVRETFQILFAIPRIEGYRALFKGLGATLVAIVPARGIHFFAYGNSKNLILEKVTKGKEGPLVHLGSAAVAGAATAMATNPIWVIKTRLQLDKSQAAGGAGRRYAHALDCLFQTVRAEGVKSLYRGLSASFVGISDTCLSWVMYEEAKRRLRVREQLVKDSPSSRSWYDGVLESFGQPLAGGSAKMLAAFLTYPHEVVRTRLRQTPTDGVLKYTGLVQCFKLVLKEEGLAGLYGGCTAHMMRVFPNAAIMFGTYEAVLRFMGAK